MKPSTPILNPRQHDRPAIWLVSAWDKRAVSTSDAPDSPQAVDQFGDGQNCRSIFRTASTCRARQPSPPRQPTRNIELLVSLDAVSADTPFTFGLRWALEVGAADTQYRLAKPSELKVLEIVIQDLGRIRWANPGGTFDLQGKADTIVVLLTRTFGPRPDCLLHQRSTYKIEGAFDMWQIFSGLRRGPQIAHNGRVWCPVKSQNLNVETCFTCDAYRSLVEEDGLTHLYCRPEVVSSPPLLGAMCP